MALLVPNHGEGDALRALIEYSGGMTLRLFTNNITPAETDTASTYTEAAFTGYAAKVLNASAAHANWTITEGAPSQASYAMQQFDSSAGSQNVNVYGCYITRTTGGRIVLAERFASAPFNIQNNGDYIQVTPNITMD